MKEDDIIICIEVKPFPVNSTSPPLGINKEYQLKEIFKCSCGEEHFNVGLKREVNYVECYKCRETLPPTNHWCHSSRFKAK